MLDHKQNWAGNYTYSAARIHHPQTLDEIRDLVRRATNVRALGTRHSFNAIADTTGDLVSLTNLNRVITLDRVASTVTVEAGATYAQLGEYLHAQGFALHNLASLPHISVGGACATATHGSGNNNPNLAAPVIALELITTTGDVLALSRATHGNQFDGMVVALGGLGIVTKLTLNLVPSFAVRQDVYENLPLAQLADHFDAITASAYSISLFTDWRGEHINQVWLKRRVTGADAPAPAPTFFGATLAPADRHPIPAASAENCTAQMGIPGPWHTRLPHFRADYTPSSGRELQTEYFVPREHAVPALRAVAQLREQIAPLLMISEVRTIAADKLWMSPCYNCPSVAIHFTWKQDWPAVQKLLPVIEAQLAPFNARPHWGKLFAISPERLRPLYEKLPDFQRLLHEFDPQGKFRNPFLVKYVFAAR